MASRRGSGAHRLRQRGRNCGLSRLIPKQAVHPENYVKLALCLFEMLLAGIRLGGLPSNPPLTLAEAECEFRFNPATDSDLRPAGIERTCSFGAGGKGLR